MMKNFSILFLFLLPVSLIAQNVGIGTLTPVNGKLEISGSTSLTQLVVGSAGNANVSVDIANPMVGFNNYYNGGYKAWVAGYSGRLVFDPTAGSLNIQTTTASLAQNAAVPFSTAMTITKDQRVGIANTAPLYKLDVGDRMRIRAGQVNNIFTTAGTWYDDYRDGTDRMFAGMMDSIRWGLYGGGTGGTGWGLNYNGKTGNLNIGNSTQTTYRITASDAEYGLGLFNEAGSFYGSLTNSSGDFAIEAAYGNGFAGTLPSNILLNPPSGNFFFYPGNVGVQTLTPTASLHVGGNAFIGAATGTPATGYKLSVKGKIICEEAKVQLSTSWPDYVFADNYQLRSLDELEQSIRKNKHLPNIPSAADVEKNGIELGDMNKRLVEKVEELTLYLIEMNKNIVELKKQNSSLQQQVNAIKK